MIDKYYTPSIEEFHVGFEYQYKVKTSGSSFVFAKDHIYLWIDDYIKSGDILSFRLDEIRVKYLNKEDIESLGFIKQDYQYQNNLEFKYGDIWKTNSKSGWLHFNTDTKILKITSLDSGSNIDGPNHSVKFNGFIKNKSELKVLLKQLEICE